MVPAFQVLTVHFWLPSIGNMEMITNGKIYIFCCSSVKWRGIFLSLYALMVGVGILLSYCLGAVLYWRYVASIAPVLYTILAFGLFLTPESPIWLLGHYGEEPARSALQWLR